MVVLHDLEQASEHVGRQLAILHGLNESRNNLSNQGPLFELVKHFVDVGQKLHFLCLFFLVNILEVPNCFEKGVLEPRICHVLAQSAAH